MNHPTATESAAYDAAGNMTCRSTTSNTQCSTTSQNGQLITYDDEGRMTNWQDAPSNPTNTEAMAYDAEGNRVALQVNGDTPTYYVGSLEELSGGSVTKYFTSCSQGSELPLVETTPCAQAQTPCARPCSSRGAPSGPRSC